MIALIAGTGMAATSCPENISPASLSVTNNALTKSSRFFPESFILATALTLSLVSITYGCTAIYIRARLCHLQGMRFGSLLPPCLVEEALRKAYGVHI